MDQEKTKPPVNSSTLEIHRPQLLLQDLAVLTGAELITEELGGKLEDEATKRADVFFSGAGVPGVRRCVRVCFFRSRTPRKMGGSAFGFPEFNKHGPQAQKQNMLTHCKKRRGQTCRQRVRSNAPQMQRAAYKGPHQSMQTARAGDLECGNSASPPS